MQRFRIQILHLFILSSFIFGPLPSFAFNSKKESKTKTISTYRENTKIKNKSQRVGTSKKSKSLSKLGNRRSRRFQKRSSLRRLQQKKGLKRYYVSKPKIKRKLKKKREKKYSFSFGTTYSESSVNFRDARDSSSISTNLGASYQFHNNFKLGGRIDGYQDLNKRSEDYGDLHAFDLSGQITKLPKPTSWLTVTPILGISLPLSKTLTEFDSLRVAFSGGISNLARLPGTKLSFSYLINYVQQIHQFEESLRGFDNKQHILTNSLGMGYQIMDRLSISVNFALTSRWTYESVYDSVFSSSQSLKYNIHKNISFRIGHMNSGQTLHSDGRSSNIQLYNENSSGVFVGINAWI